MRRIPTLILTAAGALLIVWIVNWTYWADESVPSALSGDAATDPFYAAEKLTRLLGARAEWRHDLPRDLPAGAVVVASYWNWNLIPSRRERLERWVEAGGRLIADGTLIGGPTQLEDWTGIGHDRLGYLIPPRPHTWEWRRGSEVWAARVAKGRGSVTIFAIQPYVNAELLQDEHAEMYVEATQLRAGDRVYFVSDADGTSLLALTWQRGAPALMLAAVLIALAIWRVGVSFGPRAAAIDPGRRSLAEQIKGTGRFTARFGGGRALHSASVRALTEAALRHVFRYNSLSNDERIGTLARLTGLGPTELASALNYAGPRRPADVRSTVAVLEFARRRLSEGSRYAG